MNTTKQYKRGLVVGKFYPPHRGHKYLIDTAVKACEHVVVIVCARDLEQIPGKLRAYWIARIHPSVEVKLLENYGLNDDDSKQWARFTIDYLGYAPDAVFTSEAYGHAYARYMKCVHVLVDQARVAVPISGTKIRSDPLNYSEFLEPIVRSYFIPRIVLVGAESTGKSTLAQALAKQYKTVWVPEYGRFYSEGKLLADGGATWDSREFEIIARQQQELEDALAERSAGPVICDTDAFATSIWHERYVGFRSREVERIADSRTYALYILTGDEIPWVQDGTRDGEHIRHLMQLRFRERLVETHRPFVEVKGSKEERLAQAILAIDRALSARNKKSPGVIGAYAPTTGAV